VTIVTSPIYHRAVCLVIYSTLFAVDQLQQQKEYMKERDRKE